MGLHGHKISIVLSILCPAYIHVHALKYIHVLYVKPENEKHFSVNNKNATLATGELNNITTYCTSISLFILSGDFNESGF